MNFLEIADDPQSEKFAALRDFCESDLNGDIGLGPFRPIHLFGAMHVIQIYADINGRKKYHPISNLMPHDKDFMSESETDRIAAKVWYAWGVLTQTVADKGRHLMCFATFYIGYYHSPVIQEAVLALPWMNTWFAANPLDTRVQDDMYKVYERWVKQLKEEYDSVAKLGAGVTDSAKKDMAEMLQSRKTRYERALNRTDDWLIEWLNNTVRHTPTDFIREYNTFQQIFLLNQTYWLDCEESEESEE